MVSLSELELALNGVDGWLHADEALQLYESVMSFPATQGDLLVVEIGSWMGRSTIALGLAAKERGCTRVVAIDPHEGRLRTSDGTTEPTWDVFTGNITKAGVDDAVEPMQMTSSAARPSIENGSVNVLFIDGLHDYESVRRDVTEWLSSLSEGAVVAFNDASTPGVYKVLQESVLGRQNPFTPIALVRSTLFTRYEALSTTSAERSRVRRIHMSLRARRAAHPLVQYMPAWLKGFGNSVTGALSSSHSN